MDQVGLKSKRDERDYNDYPEELRQEYLFLSNWIRELSRKYGQHILIKVIDAQSLQGFYKSVRYWITKYPTFIINKKEKYTGKDKDRLNDLLRLHLARI